MDIPPQKSWNPINKARSHSSTRDTHLHERSRLGIVRLETLREDLGRVVWTLAERLASHVVLARHLWRVKVVVVHASRGEVDPACFALAIQSKGHVLL